MKEMRHQVFVFQEVRHFQPGQTVEPTRVLPFGGGFADNHTDELNRYGQRYTSNALTTPFTCRGRW